MKMKSYIYLLFFTCVSFSTYSQQMDRVKLNYTYEIAKQFNTEIYLNCEQYQTPQYVKMTLENLKKIEIYKLEKDASPFSYKMITDATLKDKCNNSLTYDNYVKNFDIKKFNPEKYFLVPNEYYRIDGTDYLIKLKQ